MDPFALKVQRELAIRRRRRAAIKDAVLVVGLLLLIYALSGCATVGVYDPRTEIELTNVEATSDGFSAELAYYRSGQDRSIAYQRDADFVDWTYGTSSEIAAQMRGRDVQANVRIAEGLIAGFQQGVQLAAQLAPMLRAAPQPEDEPLAAMVESLMARIEALEGGADDGGDQ